MSDYFDCILFKKTKNDKTFAVKIGSAKKRDDGGFQVYLDALPTGDGSFAIVPQKARETRPPSNATNRFNQGPSELDDEIPF
jgi:hypothetical protein